MAESKGQLSPIQVRPRFRVETAQSVDEITNKIQLALDQEDTPCKGRLIPGYFTIFIPQKDQHYWSPQLSLTMEETETGTLLRGLYGPRPTVWTMFIFFYSIFGFAVLIITIVGLSYMMLDKPATILWLVPILILVFFSLYLVAYFGKKKGHDQLIILHTFVEKALGIAI